MWWLLRWPFSMEVDAAAAVGVSDAAADVDAGFASAVGVVVMEVVTEFVSGAAVELPLLPGLRGEGAMWFDVSFPASRTGGEGAVAVVVAGVVSFGAVSAVVEAPPPTLGVADAKDGPAFTPVLCRDGVAALAARGLAARELPRLATTGGLLGDAVVCDEDRAVALSALSARFADGAEVYELSRERRACTGTRCVTPVPVMDGGDMSGDSEARAATPPLLRRPTAVNAEAAAAPSLGTLLSFRDAGSGVVAAVEAGGVAAAAAAVEAAGGVGVLATLAASASTSSLVRCR